MTTYLPPLIFKLITQLNIQMIFRQTLLFTKTGELSVVLVLTLLEDKTITTYLTPLIFKLIAQINIQNDFSSNFALYRKPANCP